MASPKDSDYSFGSRAAHDVYRELCRGREGVVEKARAMARISIPTLFPPQGYRSGDYLPPPNQSVNARCINNLASRIMFTALPPGKPILKYNVVEHKLQKEIDADPALWSMTLLAMSRREIANRQRLEATSIRTAYTAAAAQLIVAGNVMWKALAIDTPSVHTMDTYVVKRNGTGQQLHNILEQVINLGDVDLSTRAFIENVRMHNHTPQEVDNNEFTEEVTIYCCCKLHHVSNTKKVWLYWEEFEGEMIPDTDVQCDYDAPPQYCAWMVPRYGQNWGGSYCEQYEGDMYIVENSNGSLNDGSEAAAMTWLFVKPGGLTSKRVLEKAENLKVMYGDAADITVFRLEKNNDFAFVGNTAGAAERRLGAAFLMVSSIQRNAERVTAEEWRQMASELDQAMGGLYSELASGMGRSIIMRFLAQQEEEDKALVPLPPGIVRVSVITGIDALSLTTDEENLEAALGVLAKLLGPEALMAALNAPDVIRRILTGYSIKPDGLVKDQAQIDQETAQAKQEAQQATILQGATPAIAKEGSAAISAALTPQLMQQMGGQQPGAAPQAPPGSNQG